MKKTKIFNSKKVNKEVLDKYWEMAEDKGYVLGSEWANKEVMVVFREDLDLFLTNQAEAFDFGRD